MIAATLEREVSKDKSVSRTGFASSNGRPDCKRSLAAQEFESSKLGIIFVTHSSYFSCLTNMRF